jgi:histidinol phosphatase-like enzyme (inositol monophosphatase family)
MTHADPDIRQRLEVAWEAACEAGRLTLQFFQHDDLQFDRKADDSPVTVADRGAEQLLRVRIAAAFPQDGIVGEEFGEQAGTSGFRWILDPIDGTKAFISGVPLYGTLVGVECDSQTLAGVIYVPALDEGVYAGRDCGAWYVRGDRPPRAARVSTRSRLAEGLFLTSQIDSFWNRGAADAYLALERAAYITRTWGDCYGYLLVAIGRAEVMVDPVANLWDLAALQPILEEAGGTFTDWQGQATIYHAEAIGCNPRVLDEVLAITRRYPRPA